MDNFNTIQQKLERFIKRYYTNELLKGAILFFTIGLLYLFVTLLVEYFLWLNPTGRTVLFWVFVIVESLLFSKFIAIPLSKLFNLRQGLNFDQASRLIGDHFPEVSDKLLNVLQLSKDKRQSDLLLASIAQKSAELTPIPFQLAVSFKSNIKYLKYAAIPVFVLLASYASGKIDWFSTSYERVINYKTAYEPPAPFQFFILNRDLNAIEGKNFKVNISIVGDIIPENVEIKFQGQSYFLQQETPGEFSYTFEDPKESLEFSLEAAEVTSKSYFLNVVKVPSLVNFEMLLDYPKYTKKRDEVVDNSGSAIIPEGTKVTWNVLTKTTDEVKLLSEDSLSFINNSGNRFSASKQIFKNLNYSITTSNKDIQNYENLAFSLNVIKDAYPELNLKAKKDTIDGQTLYFYGQLSDDYGFTKLQQVFYPVNDVENKTVKVLEVSNSNFDEFISIFPGDKELIEGETYEVYFEIFDNDAIHNFKRTKSSVFSYRKLTKAEEEQKQLQEQSKTINDISKTFDKLQEQDKKLEELSKTQKEKEELNFNDKKKFEDFLKRQKQQEQLMQNFNKKLQENLEEFQKEDEKEDEFKEELKERLKENEAQLKQDEKLLEELEKLVEKINKEEFTQKLEELAKQNQNKKRSMQQLLELTKRFYVAKKAEQLKSDLEELSKEQEELSEKQEENTKEKQEDLSKKFQELQEELDNLNKDNKALKKPMEIPQDKPLEERIKKDQKEAAEKLKEKEEQPQGEQQPQQGASQKQKSAAKKMKQLSEMIGQMMAGGGGGDQMAEDAEMLRQILDNLVLFSLDQEELMEQFNSIDINHNRYGKFIVKQNDLREYFEHIDDSLFSLSLRQPKLSEEVNKQITEVYFNIDKSLGLLSENRLYQGVASQQYVITASNQLASFLSDVLDNMESQMNPGMGQGEGQDQQIPDIIMSQEELNKQMEEGVKKGESGKPEDGQEGEEGEKGEKGEKGDNDRPGKEGKDGKENGENGKSGQSGKSGQNNQQGENGKKEGYGEGGNEELNGELFKIYQQQQQIRQALQDRLSKEGKMGSAGDLIQQMEDIELDLLNKGFTNQTLQKMMELQHQLLKLENATFTQGQDTKRKSKTNKQEFSNSIQKKYENAKNYFNTTEILNRQSLPLRETYKQKVQEYFKNKNDQF